MNDTEFDMQMRRLAERETIDSVSSERLNRVLAQLPKARPRMARIPSRRLLIAVIAAVLVCATAVAAQLGLPFFMEINPYNFFRQAEEPPAEVQTQPLSVADASGLTSLRVTPLDSAWIEGRLTLTVRVESAQEGGVLYAGERNDDGTVNVYRHAQQPPEQMVLADGAVLLIQDEVTCYTQPEGADGWPGNPAYMACEEENGVLMLAVQVEPDFITASDLETLSDDNGRIPIRLEMPVFRDSKGNSELESVLLLVKAPSESEKEEMNP